MKHFYSYKILLIILFFFNINTIAKSQDFEISGFSLGMTLADKLATNEIAQGNYRKFYNSKYITTISFPKSTFFPDYDYTQFSFKKKDKKQKIINIEVVKNYKDNIAECFAKREKILNEIKEKYKKKIEFIDDIGTKPFNKSFGKKGTNTVTWIGLKGKKLVYVSCYNYAESETSSVDQFRMGVNNSYFEKMAFKK